MAIEQPDLVYDVFDSDGDYDDEEDSNGVYVSIQMLLYGIHQLFNTPVWLLNGVLSHQYSVCTISPIQCVYHLTSTVCVPSHQYSVCTISPVQCVYHLTSTVCVLSHQYSVCTISPVQCVYHLTSTVCVPSHQYSVCTISPAQCVLSH